MPQVIFIHPDGAEDTVDVSEGTSLMMAAVSNGIDGIIGECGGNAMCVTCHVYIDDQSMLAPPGAVEDELLEGTAAEREECSRLGCQIPVTGAMEGLRVRLPARQI